MKTIIKLFMPSSKTLSKLAADGIQKTVNKSDKQAMISKYSQLGNQAAEIAAWATKMLEDGQIDDLERDEIAEKLDPLFKKLEEII